MNLTIIVGYTGHHQRLPFASPAASPVSPLGSTKSRTLGIVFIFVGFRL